MIAKNLTFDKRRQSSELVETEFKNHQNIIAEKNSLDIVFYKYAEKIFFYENQIIIKKDIFKFICIFAIIFASFVFGLNIYTKTKVFLILITFIS